MSAPLAKDQIALLMSDSVTYRVSPVQRAGRVRRTSLFSVIADAVRSIVEFPRRQAVLNELSRLSDRELADIGLHRAELRQVFARR